MIFWPKNKLEKIISDFGNDSEKILFKLGSTSYITFDLVGMLFLK